MYHISLSNCKGNDFAIQWSWVRVLLWIRTFLFCNSSFVLLATRVSPCQWDQPWHIWCGDSRVYKIKNLFLGISISIICILLTNKRPKGPHIVHLSTMCHLFDGLARAASYFSNQPEKHKLGRGRWDLASYQVSFNSVKRFQRRSRKCLSQSEARAAILFFRSAQKAQTW